MSKSRSEAVEQALARLALLAFWIAMAFVPATGVSWWWDHRVAALCCLLIATISFGLAVLARGLGVFLAGLRKHRVLILTSTVALVGVVSAGAFFLRTSQLRRHAEMQAKYRELEMTQAEYAVPHLPFVCDPVLSPGTLGALRSATVDFPAFQTAAFAALAIEKLNWRTWMAGAANGGSPAASLAPKSDYVFHLELARELRDEPNVATTGLSEPLREAISECISAGKPLILTTVLLTDPDALGLAHGEAESHDLVINVNALLEPIGEQGRDAVARAVATSLGSVDYRLHSGSKQGWTYAAVVLIKDNRALDQIVARYCVGVCSASPSEVSHVPGPAMLTALLEDSMPSDASLFLTELEEHRLHGVLILAQPQNGRRVWTWSTTRSGQSFYDYLRSTIVAQFKDFDTVQQLLVKGRSFTDFVFPATADGKAAQAAFDSFVAASPPQLGDGQSSSRLFVKFDFAPQDETLIILPFGLLVTNINDREGFVGHHVEIEQPLVRANYRQQSVCPSQWVALVPNGGAKTLRLAEDALDKTGTAWTAASGLEMYDDLNEFRKWLRKGTDEVSTSLLVLSHHSANQLYFFPDNPVVSANIRSAYASPSIAILIGCGTGQPGAVDFVRQFNEHGFDAAIVSSFDVHPAVAGAYAGCFRQYANSGPSSGLNLSYVHFQAVNNCQWPKTDLPILNEPGSAKLEEHLSATDYAANALKFTLVGNGNLLVCPVPTIAKNEVEPE